MEVRVLGPVEVIDGDHRRPIAGVKPRSILTVLGLHAGEVVGAETIVDVLWGETPPRTAISAVRTHVATLRRALGEGAIVTQGSGWVVTADAVDAVEFEAAAVAGRQAARAGVFERAIASFDVALGLWRAPPQLPDTPRGQAESTRWLERFHALSEDRWDALLAVGETAPLTGELEAAVAEAPLRERRWGQLMLCLYRAGRQAEALRAYQRARSRLADELGIEPSEELRRLEGAILAQDRSLDAVPSAGRPPPPSGKPRLVTLVFTDVEGSTGLLLAAGERWPAILARHHAILRTAFGAQEGIEVGSAGDALFFAFDRPASAVVAAATAQRALAEEPWPDGLSVAVRMGVHTGEVTDSDTGLVGLALHETARIAAAAHGRQILVSGTTAGLVRADQLGKCELIDLGAFRLRDMPGEAHLHQVAARWLPGDHPPPRASGARQRTLPTALNSFVGRDDDLAAFGSLLRTHRLLTVFGPGGTGKTRTAIELAREAEAAWRDGAVFVDLAPAGPGDVVRAAASALQVSDLATGDLLAQVVDFLRGRSLLLVVDNCEHVVRPAAAFVAAVLSETAGVNVLATSRVPLGVPGEAVYRLEPLETPVGSDDLKAESCRLFVDRATEADARLDLDDAQQAAVAGICRLVEGLPLAIELAASQVRVFTPVEIERNLAHRVTGVETSSDLVPNRHRSLRRTIEWSYDLLDSSDREVLQRLAVFSGGFSMAGATAAIGDSAPRAVTHLIDCSLVVAERHGLGTRYRLLESIREFATDELQAAGLEDQARRRHCTWIETLVATASPNDGGWADDDALRSALVEIDNIRTAFDWALAGGDLDAARTIASQLVHFWHWSSLPAEGFERLEAALASGNGDPIVRARTMAAYEYVAGYAGRDSLAASDEIAPLLEAAGDQLWLAVYLLAIGSRLSEAGDVARSLETLQRAVDAARDSGDRWWHAGALVDLANVEIHWGRPEAAERHGREAVAIFRELGTGGSQLAAALMVLARQAGWRGDYSAALDLFEEIISEKRTSGHRTALAWALLNRSRMRMAVGAFEAAEADIEEGRQIAADVRDGETLVNSHHNMAELAVRQGRLGDARRLLVTALESRSENTRLWCVHLRGVTEVLDGNHDYGLRLLGAWRTFPGTPKRQDVDLFERALARATDALGAARVTELLAGGTQLSTTDAVALAREPATIPARSP